MARVKGTILRTSNSEESFGYEGATGTQLETVKEPLERSHGA